MNSKEELLQTAGFRQIWVIRHIQTTLDSNVLHLKKLVRIKKEKSR